MKLWNGRRNQVEEEEEEGNDWQKTKVCGRCLFLLNSLRLGGKKKANEDNSSLAIATVIVVSHTHTHTHTHTHRQTNITSLLIPSLVSSVFLFSYPFVGNLFSSSDFRSWCSCKTILTLTRENLPSCLARLITSLACYSMLFLCSLYIC